MRLFRLIGLLLVPVLLAAGMVVPAATAPPARAALEAPAAATLPTGFREIVAHEGLERPTAVRFAPDGRVFVAEKSGLVRVFDGPADRTPSTWADLRTQVHDFLDRGLLGLALAPGFPADPSVYVLYTLDADPAAPGVVPAYGRPGVAGDPCADPTATTYGCPALGRLSRLRVPAGGGAPVEEPLLTGWCQQFPFHSVGSLAFGPDGSLYAGAGDGAGVIAMDHGQHGGGTVPRNPCGDPPGGVGAALTAPTAEGGAFRSQDLRTAGDPVDLSGTIIRVDPATGRGVPANPLADEAEANAQRVVATGLRNPFRMTVRPGTQEVWTGDVGYYLHEEVNRIVPGRGAPANLGWPCHEGPVRQEGFAGAGYDVCRDLYADGSAQAPHWSYPHDGSAAGESCPRTDGSSVSGLAFYPGGSYPDAYDGALFVADYARGCIWSLRAGPGGVPDPATAEPFAEGAAAPVDLVAGPGGDLHYADIMGGRIVRIVHAAGNRPPVARVTATPTEGAAPLTVAFDGGGSTDPDGGALVHTWDLDGDGAFDDAQGVRATRTYTAPGTVTARLRVADSAGAVGTAEVRVTAGNTRPDAALAAPAATATWAVGQEIAFRGSAADAQQGVLPASALRWELILRHCQEGGGCHEHPVRTWAGVASGSFSAPDHEYPSELELRLTATDAGGLTDTAAVVLRPRTVQLSVASDPPGLALSVNGRPGTSPVTRTVVEGSRTTVTAPSPQDAGGRSLVFDRWSDAGARTHDVVAPADTALTARFRPAVPSWTAYARVNFQPTAAPVPGGYRADIGAVYGDRGGLRTYGWDRPNPYALDRGAASSPDQRWDTFAHTQRRGTNLRWELAVPSGEYRVRLVCGDPVRRNSDYRVDVEGVRACNARPTADRRWTEATVVVRVTDGRLTLTNAPGGSNNKLAFVDVDRRSAG
jgi:glucose/arabinose dehydrogenase